ncbi:helix-loop-helix DNA-binding domain-containing protein [Colletotrichum navitas]|uniref:Helix-loop-helix DNA-binding domain-containing protein n=1 Tax=Colletotrichum navitas TaxID=681940 RepID=A0AAD8QB67_9PEZI|nr:helix-loop-helix DNA-binding domain-containing protein [Colletotrichum navitas]KAK1598751.1 helix-loop-helix DNA-binding domain-containing protein [Colletotrichum navitas]
MMASTPMPPHFPPDISGGTLDFGDRPHHATRPGNQPTLLSPDHNRPNAFNEPSRATIARVQSRQVADLQHQLPQHELHHSALGLGLTHADYAHQRQPGPGATSLADQQSLSPLLRSQGQQQQPNAWLPREYGVVPVYHGSQQQHADATSSHPSFSATAAGVNPSATIPAAGGPGDDSSDSFGTGRHLYDFGFAAPPPGEPLFLGQEYADITPLSSAAHRQPPTTNLDLHPSPWRPGLQDSSSVTLTPSMAAVAAAELNHDARKHGKGSMDTDDSDVRDPPRDDEESAVPEARVDGTAGTSKAHKTVPGARRQQRKGKRRAEGGHDHNDENDDNDDNDDDDDNNGGGPVNPADRTGVSGRSTRFSSAVSSAGSSAGSSGKAAVAAPPRLRSASRTSKNQSQKQTETPEERRTRATHNLVEKQYRNRLNAQFEGLLHALPEQVRGAAGAGAGNGDESDPPQQADQERRVSKAEVLDMARRHIKNLEQEREALHRERGELLRSLETLEKEAVMDETSASSWRNT